MGNARWGGPLASGIYGADAPRARWDAAAPPIVAQGLRPTGNAHLTQCLLLACMLLGTSGAARRYQGFPVVTNLHDMLLIGYISRSMLDDVLAKVRNATQRNAFSASARLRRTIAASLSGRQVRHTVHTVCVCGVPLVSTVRRREATVLLSRVYPEHSH